MRLTKTKYVRFIKCPSMAWHFEFDPPQQIPSSSFALAGTDLGVLARNYFGTPAILVDPDHLPTEPGLYAEYRFRHGDLLCDADLLRINEDRSIAIYEVKSGSEKENYLDDVSFQYYVAVSAGWRVESITLLLLRKDYVYDGVSHDLKQLFFEEDVTDVARDNLADVGAKVAAYLAMRKDNPPVAHPFCKSCKEDDCPFVERCKALLGLPATNSVYELPNASYKAKNERMDEGIRTFADFRNSPRYAKASPAVKIVVDTALGTDPLYLDKASLAAYLGKVAFPAYFFDFETESVPLPRYAGTHPFQVIPFQYSLHVMNSLDEDIKAVKERHEQYLGNGVDDPREELIKQMIHDLGDHGSIIVYSQGTEHSIIERLAKEFPTYEKELHALAARIYDLRGVFNCGPKKAPAIYHDAMKGRNTIKCVLPTFFPNDPELSYASLDTVHRGDEATTAYQRLGTLPENEKEDLRKAMLRYCCLDTFAMVALYIRFLEFAGLR